MWLLSTDRAELHSFTSPENAPPYAILSHLWGDSEQTFQDLQRLRKKWAALRINPRDHVGVKIRRFCEVAASHGHKWVWIDTCCIDKSSSTELSEAINSMYRYYSLATTCYAYLHDVLAPQGTNSDPMVEVERGSAQSVVVQSKWHTRGWTLQELIAPACVAFFDMYWTPLGGKVDISEDLSKLTHIPSGLLRLEQEVSDFSMAQRMSWAADRKTTREEDIAYSLMGILDVNIPVIYGEGSARAFQRLQEELMKRYIDTTPLAWGESCPLTFLAGEGVAVEPTLGSGTVYATSSYDFSNSGCIVLSESPKVQLHFNCQYLLK